MSSVSGDAEQLVHKAHFSRRSGFEHDALQLADHAHDLVLLCVRWYCKFGISYRDHEELMSERNLNFRVAQ